MNICRSGGDGASDRAGADAGTDAAGGEREEERRSDANAVSGILDGGNAVHGCRPSVLRDPEAEERVSACGGRCQVQASELARNRG